MNKEEWQNLYLNLDKIYSEFSASYPDYDKGRNEKIRKDAKRKVDNSISSAEFHIGKHPEAQDLLMSEVFQNSQYGYGEFVIPRYFDTDMGAFLKAIKEKIDSLASE